MRRSHTINVAGWPDREVTELAERQRTMITRRQLLALDISAQAIDRAVRRGRLQRVHRGVYSLVPTRARPSLAAEQAAILVCGPSALLSHYSAARVEGLRLPAAVAGVHVTVTDSDRAHPGLVIHTTTALHARDRRRVQGLPVTAPARTLIDLAPLYTLRQLAPLVDQTLRMTSRTQLLEALERHPRRPGTPRLRALLGPARPSADTWSRAEARLLAAIRRAGLPIPEANVPIGNYIADLYWRAQRVILEYDSEPYHSGPASFHRDRARHNDLATAGHQVLHVTEPQLAHELERVIVWITLALARGGGW
ncbi:MAG TPA: type IV toxin-antitoxin system AbiEi family antitoxin domain-containing protein [Solirubrobacteraceae bacterium]|nr:type IV toxin-antitoxin system AbiEi family antitoxin domain-containing protein [Solirubrobacteraceae bacterium]